MAEHESFHGRISAAPAATLGSNVLSTLVNYQTIKMRVGGGDLIAQGRRHGVDSTNFGYECNDADATARILMRGSNIGGLS